MSKPFEQRNQSATASRKLKSLAKESGLDVKLVTTLANFTWDYDPSPHFPKEATGWVDNSQLPSSASEPLKWVADSLGIASDIQLTRSAAEQLLLDAFGELSASMLWPNFLAAGTSKNFGHVSEFASFHYLRGATQSRLQSLDWGTGPMGILDIARNLFLKFFRGGSIERYNLAYLWADLCIPVETIQPPAGTSTGWVGKLLERIEALPERSGLKDLLDCCTGLVGGSKGFKQEVLQALTYADVIRVNGLTVKDMFIPERRSELGPHFYSNEWSFPLRFWSVNGGTVNRSAVPELDPA